MSVARAFTWLKHALIAVTLLVALLHLGFRVQLITDHRVDLGAAEINVVYGIQKILLGRPLYEDPEKAPFDVMQYTPAYYGICAGAGKMLAIDPHDTNTLFLLSRIISLVINLITCLCVFRLCRALGSDAWFSVAVCAVVFTLFTEHFYSRIDSLYALLFVATMITHVRWLEQGGPVKLLVSTALLAVLCLFTKQTGILIIGIIGAHLLLTKRWKPLLLYSGGVLLFSAIGMGLICLSTTPAIFVKNTVLGIANGMSGTMYLELFPPPIYKYYVPLHVAGILLIVFAIRKGDAVDRFLATVICIAFVFGLITGLKHGSNINYLFEAHMLALVGVVRWMTMHMKTYPLPRMGVVLLFMLLFTVFRTRQIQRRIGENDFAGKQTAMDMIEDETLHKELLNALGLRPEDRVFITYRGHLELLLNGQGLLAQKDIIEWSVDPLYDYSAFTQMMDDGSVRFVVADQPMDTLHFLGRSWTPLRLVAHVNSRLVYTLPVAR